MQEEPTGLGEDSAEQDGAGNPLRAVAEVVLLARNKK
jgi:hypothetical protein